MYERVLEAGATAKPLEGASGSLLVANDGQGVLVVCGLDKAPSTKTYQAWVIAGKSSRSRLVSSAAGTVAARSF